MNNSARIVQSGKQTNRLQTKGAPPRLSRTDFVHRDAPTVRRVCIWVCVRVGKSKCIWLLSTRIYPSIRLSRPLGDSSLFGKYHHCVIRQKLYFTTGKRGKKETIFTYLRKACEEPHVRHTSQPSINSACFRDERASKRQQGHGVVERSPVWFVGSTCMRGLGEMDDTRREWMAERAWGKEGSCRTIFCTQIEASTRTCKYCVTLYYSVGVFK